MEKHREERKRRGLRKSKGGEEKGRKEWRGRGR